MMNQERPRQEPLSYDELLKQSETLQRRSKISAQETFA
jgi:hypothetical protein